MRNDQNRARYYRARADRIEAENTLKQQELISKEMVATNLQGFCKAIEGKMRASKLGPELKAEVSEDLGDFLQKLSGNGKPRGHARKTRPI